jgi:general secretion pathway protein C
MNAASWLESLPPPDKWRTLALAHGPRVATWALALALGVQAAMIVTDLAGASRSPAAATGSSAATPEAQRHSVDVAAITNTHLFGAPPVQAVPEQNAANAPQTSMPLVLTGIISADNPENGLAILGETAAAAKVYAVGDNVRGGAKLHSVFSDRVVLDRNGRLETLALPRQYQAGTMPNAPPPSAAALQTENPVIDRMRKLMTDEPGLMADIMRPQPVFAQGKQRGYRVYPGRNRQAFVRLGLRPGDLVTAINGTPLDDPARGQEIFRTIGSSSEAHVTVMRNGQQQDLTLNMAQVAQEAEALVGTQGMAPVDQAQPVPPPTADPSNPPDSTQ